MQCLISECDIILMYLTSSPSVNIYFPLKSISLSEQIQNMTTTAFTPHASICSTFPSPRGLEHDSPLPSGLVGRYELLISNQPTKLPMRYYNVITSALRSPYINKQGNFCAEE